MPTKSIKTPQKVHRNARNGVVGPDWDKIKSAERSKCHKCHSPRSYTNPLDRCWECKNRFCYDHLWAGLYKRGMRDNEPLRDVCRECILENDYSDPHKGLDSSGLVAL